MIKILFSSHIKSNYLSFLLILEIEENKLKGCMLTVKALDADSSQRPTTKVRGGGLGESLMNEDSSQI